MKQRWLLPSLSLALAVLACSLPPGTPPPAATEPPAPSGLTAGQLRNAAYTLEGCDGASQTFTLADGAYASGPDPLAPGYTAISMGDLIAFGDLDYDGSDDAAALLGVNCGGTGVFTYLVAVLDSDGVPVPAAIVFIDDRPMIDNLVISSGEVLADILIHAPEDPMCCPSFRTRQGYRLYGASLVRSHRATWTAGGERAIAIASPADLAEVAYPLTVSGSVTIGPFENTLAYNVYAPDNSLVTGGSVMTDSPEPGAPGDFSLTLDLGLAGVTGRVRIEFVETSMMDGSVVTLDSVLVWVP